MKEEGRNHHKVICLWKNREFVMVVVVLNTRSV